MLFYAAQTPNPMTDAPIPLQLAASGGFPQLKRVTSPQVRPLPQGRLIKGYKGLFLLPQLSTALKDQGFTALWHQLRSYYCGGKTTAPGLTTTGLTIGLCLILLLSLPPPRATPNNFLYANLHLRDSPLGNWACNMSLLVVGNNS